ncbi:hypothetical protein Ancab_004084 [Ancistrocladus abbreviatus]
MARETLDVFSQFSAGFVEVILAGAATVGWAIDEGLAGRTGDAVLQPRLPECHRMTVRHNTKSPVRRGAEWSRSCILDHSSYAKRNEFGQAVGVGGM